MAAPQDAPLPPDLDLGPGFTLRVTALSTADGSVVSGVSVSNFGVVNAAAFSDVGQPPPPPPPPPPPLPPPPPPLPPIVTGTYAQLVSQLQPPAGAFTAQRTITSLAAFNVALSKLKAGDDYLVQGVTFPGEIVLNPRLSGYARFTFDHACVFSGYGGSTWVDKPNLYLPEPSFLQLVFQPGCVMTNPRGSDFIDVFGGHDIVLDGFAAAKSGGHGLHCSPVNADLVRLWIRGQASDNGHNAAAWDPHAEKGSGLHAAYLANGKVGQMHDVTFALYTHDQSACAGDVQLGSSHEIPHTFKLYVKAGNLSFVSKTQTGGNATQCWGTMGTGIVYEIIEASNIQGKALWTRNLVIPPQPGITVRQGSAVNAVQNPRWRGESPWDTHGGVVYQPGPFSPQP